MRTARATLTGALIASLLVVPSAAVLGQSETTASSTHVTGTVLEQTRYESDDVSASQAGDVMREEGHVYKQRVDWSDPRLPAEHWVRMDLSIYDEGSEDGVMTVQTSHLLTDSDGAWRGTGRAFETEADRYSYLRADRRGSLRGAPRPASGHARQGCTRPLGSRIRRLDLPGPADGVPGAGRTCQRRGSHGPHGTGPRGRHRLICGRALRPDGPRGLPLHARDTRRAGLGRRAGECRRLRGRACAVSRRSSGSRRPTRGRPGS